MVTASPSGHGREPQARAMAAAWLGRLHADDRTLADEKAFRAWLQEPANRAAFQQVTDVWEDAAIGREGWRGPARPVVGRRLLLAGIGAAGFAGLWFGLPLRSEARTYETGVGERREVHLDDGSRLALDALTQVKLRADDRLSEATVVSGRVNLTAADQPGRLSLLCVDDVKVVVGGASVDVCRRGTDRWVLATAGDPVVIRRARLGGATTKRVLAPGERFGLYDGIERVDRPDLAEMTAWRQGRVILDSRRLGDAAAEMNLYSHVRLVIEDPGIADLRVSGVYRVGDNQAFAQSIAALMGLRADVERDRVTLRAADKAPPQG